MNKFQKIASKIAKYDYDKGCWGLSYRKMKNIILNNSIKMNLSYEEMLKRKYRNNI